MAMDLITNCNFEQPTFEELQKAASAHAGFDLSKPVDLSALFPDRCTQDLVEGEYGRLSLTLTTILRGHLQAETNEEELIITIVRKNVMKRPVLEGNIKKH